MKNLELLGVQEMNTKEMKNTNGGLWGIIVLGILIASLLITSFDN